MLISDWSSDVCSSDLYLVLSQWLVFGMAWLVFAMLGRRLLWSRSRIGALTLVAGLGNTSFVGYTLIAALRGQEGLAYAVIADQGGCFIALAVRSEAHTSELPSLMRISYAFYCLQKTLTQTTYS